MASNRAHLGALKRRLQDGAALAEARAAERARERHSNCVRYRRLESERERCRELGLPTSQAVEGSGNTVAGRDLTIAPGAAELDEHGDIDALAVPDERPPAKNAPGRRLLGYLIRLWLRAWLRRIEGVRPGGSGKSEDISSDAR